MFGAIRMLAGFSVSGSSLLKRYSSQVARNFTGNEYQALYYEIEKRLRIEFKGSSIFNIAENEPLPFILRLRVVDTLEQLNAFSGDIPVDNMRSWNCLRVYTKKDKQSLELLCNRLVEENPNFSVKDIFLIVDHVLSWSPIGHMASILRIPSDSAFNWRKDILHSNKYDKLRAMNRKCADIVEQVWQEFDRNNINNATIPVNILAHPIFDFKGIDLRIVSTNEWQTRNKYIKTITVFVPQYCHAEIINKLKQHTDVLALDGKYKNIRCALWVREAELDLPEDHYKRGEKLRQLQEAGVIKSRMKILSSDATLEEAYKLVNGEDSEESHILSSQTEDDNNHSNYLTRSW